jgi:hypothetical protein
MTTTQIVTSSSVAFPSAAIITEPNFIRSSFAITNSGNNSKSSRNPSYDYSGLNAERSNALLQSSEQSSPDRLPKLNNNKQCMRKCSASDSHKSFKASFCPFLFSKQKNDFYTSSRRRSTLSTALHIDVNRLKSRRLANNILRKFKKKSVISKLDSTASNLGNYQEQEAKNLSASSSNIQKSNSHNSNKKVKLSLDSTHLHDETLMTNIIEESLLNTSASQTRSNKSQIEILLEINEPVETSSFLDESRIDDLKNDKIDFE